jgi:signal transduction histidine kinase
VKNWGGFLRILGFAAVFVTVATAFFAFGVVRNNIDSIRTNWRENLLWSSSQLGIEYLRFREALLGAGSGQETFDSKEVNRRFDILWSRVTLFQQGRIAERIKGFPKATRSVEQIFQLLKQAEPVVEGLQAGDRDKALELWHKFKASDDLFRSLNRIVMRGEVQAGAVLRQGLERNQWVLYWLGIGAVLFSLMLLVYFAYETRWHRRVSQENADLFRQAQLANRTKSAFLTMMSHELRTPMNGILGMIALARREGGSPQQAQMLGIAEQSSQQLNELLLDIVEFADLETADLALSHKPFSIAALCAQVENALTADGQGKNQGLLIEIAKDCPPRLRGDLPRLRQALVYMARYLAAMSSSDVRMRFDYQAGNLQVSIFYDQELPGKTWVPHFIDASQIIGEEGFAKNEMGTEIACGFINSMNGTLLHHPPQNGQHLAMVLVQVPLQALDGDVITVRIETQSQALAAICQNALASFPVRFYEPANPGPVHTVIIEAGGTFEKETYERLVSCYPEANFVALGSPCKASRFDGQINLPIDKEALRQAAYL